jgi:uncharacterized hydrophobic protein (TIGR00341 family)
LEELLKEHSSTLLIRTKLYNKNTLISALIDARDVEPVLDILERNFSEKPDFSVVLLPVEAVLPIPKSVKEPSPPQEEKKEMKVGRVSRHELYGNISANIELSKTFLAMVFLSTIVAGLGLLHNNVALVIGAMVLAPLLTPNVALSLANTLGDTSLAKDSLKTGSTGLLLALMIACLMGLFLPVDPQIYEIASRTKVGWSDLILALVAGSAGVFAFTGATAMSLVGVMVAVAILPPLVVLGLMLGAGYWSLAEGAFLLVIANVICVNLAGILTFWFLGVKPAAWWEEDKAKQAMKVALIIWTLLLIVLIVIIYWTQGR